MTCVMLPFETEAAGSFPSYFAWIVAGTMLVVALTCWLSMRKGAARAAAADAEMLPLQTALNTALGQIEGFSGSQGRFVSSLANEIKTPLATVLIQANLLLGSAGEPATVQRYATSVAEDVQHLSDLVEGFLRMASPFSYEDASHHVPVHFHDLVLDGVRRCQSLAGARDVHVVATLAESGSGASVEVLGDAVLLGAMIGNLVRNAVLSAPRGTRVNLCVRIQGDEVVLSVRDHGAKLDHDDLDSVFDRCFRASILPRASSTSLGLAIAKRVAEHHRGTISLRNVPEGGCEFEVQLPRWHPGGAPGTPTTMQALSQMR